LACPQALFKKKGMCTYNSLGAVVCKCKSVPNYGLIQAIAIVALLSIGVWFPLYCLRLIMVYRPVGSKVTHHP
jgi:hypothetical protein